MARFKDGDVFANFLLFKEALSQYSQETYTTWVVHRSRTVVKRNKEMLANSKSGGAKPIDEAVGMYYIVYQCKHSGEVRKSGKGIRPNQRVSYLQLPEQRCLSGQNLEIVTTFIETGVTVHRIQEYLRCNEGHVLLAKDIHNLAQKLKKDKQQDKSEEQLLIEKLQELEKEHTGLVVSLQINEDSGQLEYLLLMTTEMKETFHRFQEVLFLDATYNTNRLRWPLFTFLVEDGHGKGQPVSYVIVSRETNINIENFVEKFTELVDI